MILGVCQFTQIFPTIRAHKNYPIGVYVLFTVCVCLEEITVTLITIYTSKTIKVYYPKY